jgi:NAD(P)H-dependent FMN reductase
MSPPLKLALIYGSTRQGRFCDTVARWAAAQIAGDASFGLQLIDPRTMQDTALMQGIGDADAFVVVTPEYNHGYPAPLKALIDSLSDAWHAKPVAFVSYGGVSGGLRAMEQLRQVFAELHAVTIRDSVSFANAREQFNAAGELLAPERAGRTMARVLTQLRWWAGVLREARIAQPYSALLP